MITIQTDDGSCPAQVLHPDGPGPWPGVLMYMDGIGMRPALVELATRIAGGGYYVLLPDLFYRAGAYEPIDPKKLFGDEAARAVWREKMFSTATAANVMRDTRAFLAHLAAEPRVRGPRFGVTGYCMGGHRALCAAGQFPEQIAAAASFHGGNPANDAPDSPHLGAARMRARVYAAGATDDASFPEEQKQRLERALTDAHVAHTIETYPARHGWVPTDTPTHDPACAERHFTALFALLAETIR
jgi:carboxymethylenebutenolidase